MASAEAVDRIEKVRSEMHLYQMNLMFPGAVEKCEMEFSHRDFSYTVIVRFRNGYVLRWPEEMIGSDEFKANAIMLYDLPEKEV